MTLARTPSMMLWTRGFSDLLRDREQRFFERQAGLHQRGELARQQRQIGGGDAAPQGEAAIALGFAVFDLGDGDRQQLPLAQQLPHVLDGVAFDHALAVRGPRCRARCIRRHPWLTLTSVLARDAQDFFDRGLAAQHLRTAVVADARASCVRA